MKLHLTLFLLLLVINSGYSQANADVPVYGYKIVNTYPHDTGAFTQGLLYLDGHLYESTGIRGESSVRKVDLETGNVLRIEKLPDRFFGEGIVEWRDQLIGLTWQSRMGFVLGLQDFSVRDTFAYTGEGWGLTRNDDTIFMSDGTAEIRLLDPETLKEKDRITVTYNDKPLRALNELEWVNGEIFANIYLTDLIAHINPDTGAVTGIINLTGILPEEDYVDGYTDVLNGIAYDSDTDRLFVTGKRWPKLFEIELIEQKPVTQANP